jgi:hypothetical protein
VYAAGNAFSQTATFDGKVHEDSLPAMPSWETAASRKVEIMEEPETHEMDRLKHDSSPGALGSGTISPPARPIPMRNGSATSLGAGSPRLQGQAFPAGQSPYGQPSGYGQNQNYGSRTNLTDGYGGGYRGANGGQQAPPAYGNDSYGNDRYNNNDHYNAGSGGTGGAYGRPPRSPGYTGTPTGTSGYDYPSGPNNSSNYDRHGGGGGYANTNPRTANVSPLYGAPDPRAGNSSPRQQYGNQSPRPGNASPRQAAYPGQAAYGGGAGRGGQSWRDL